MADIVPLGTNFDLGFQSDVSRDELPPRAAYRMRDYIPQLDAPLRKRGGWTYASPDLSGLAAMSSVASIGLLPLPSGELVIAVGETGSAVSRLGRDDNAGGSALTDNGDTSIVPTWPIFTHRSGTEQRSIILGGFDQTAKTPKYFKGGIFPLEPLGGTPPKARMGFSWGAYLVLGDYLDPSDSTRYSGRWAFSAAGDADSWTLTGPSASTFDFPAQVVAGVPVLNSILGFTYQDCWIITGDTPPPGGNLSLKILFSGLGTFDGRTAVAWKNTAIWANNSGVYSSDGATQTDLTAQGGISNFYRETVRGFSPAQGYNATASIFRDRYILQIRTPEDASVTTLVCDLNRRVWTEWTNIPAGVFAHRMAGQGSTVASGDEELFFAHLSAPYLGRISSLWIPSLSTAYDADDSPVLPSLETGFFKIGALQPKRIRRIYLGYDVRAFAGEGGLSVSYATSPEEGAAYTAVTGNFDVTTEYRRRHFHVNRAALGVAFKIAQNSPSADTRLYSIEGEAHTWENFR